MPLSAATCVLTPSTNPAAGIARYPRGTDDRVSRMNAASEPTIKNAPRMLANLTRAVLPLQMLPGMCEWIYTRPGMLYPEDAMGGWDMGRSN